ncbi:MAG: zf-HC2 domain-containing protein [Rhodanobacter sp.]
MDCKIASELLPPYFDGELDRTTSRELEAHLDGCAHCRDALIGLDALRTTLREEAPRHPAPELLRARIRKEISRTSVPMQSAAFAARSRHAGWLAMAASWVVMFAAGGMWMSMRNHAGANEDAQSQISRDMFAGHWRALAANSPFDVVSTDQHTVKPWFAGKVSVAPLVQDFTAQGFALVGGRIDYVGSERVPVLVYRHGHHLIDVFVLSPDHAPALDNPVQSQGYLQETVMLGGQPATIVSDMGGADLAHFAQLLGSVK